MRARVVGLTLVGLGGCALAVALLVRLWLAPAPQALALDASFETVAEGRATYLDPADLVARNRDDVALTVAVRGDAASGDADGDTAVWTAETTTSDADGTLVATGTAVACLDRRSAEAVACAAASVDGEPVEAAGLTAVFPPDTPPRDLDVWDGTVREPVPARFTGTAEIGGLEVYRFQQEVPEQVVGEVTVPARLFGDDGDGTVAADVVHRNARTLFVEPVSGVVVSSEEDPLTVLRGAGGRPGPVLLAGSFRSTGATVDDALARAREILDRRSLTGTVLPWTLGGSGAALVLAGVLLVARSRPAAASQVEDEPARVPVPTA